MSINWILGHKPQHKLGAKQQELQDLSTTDYAHNLYRINLVRWKVA